MARVKITETVLRDGHQSIAATRMRLRQMLPENVELVSGPGCPVCVTPDDYMDKAITYALREDTIITTFGDMLKVPGSKSSLMEAKAEGADIRIVYSPLDALAIARENPEKKVVFLAVGFETTAPTAAAILEKIPLFPADAKLATRAAGRDVLQPIAAALPRSFSGRSWSGVIGSSQEDFACRVRINRFIRIRQL